MMTLNGHAITPIIDEAVAAGDLDCVAFVRYFYSECGVQVPDPREDVAKFRAMFDPVKEAPAPGDLAQLDFDGDRAHIGVFVGDGVARGTTDGSVVIDRRLNVCGYFRPREARG